MDTGLFYYEIIRARRRCAPEKRCLFDYSIKTLARLLAEIHDGPFTAND